MVSYKTCLVIMVIVLKYVDAGGRSSESDENSDYSNEENPRRNYAAEVTDDYAEERTEDQYEEQTSDSDNSDNTDYGNRDQYPMEGETSTALGACVAKLKRVFKNCGPVNDCFKILYFDLVINELQNDETKEYFQRMVALAQTGKPAKQELTLAEEFCKERAKQEIAGDADLTLASENKYMIVISHHTGPGEAAKIAEANIAANNVKREQIKEIKAIVEKCTAELTLNDMFKKPAKYILEYKKLAYYEDKPNTKEWAIPYLEHLFGLITVKPEAKELSYWCEEKYPK